MAEQPMKRRRRPTEERIAELEAKAAAIREKTAQELRRLEERKRQLAGSRATKRGMGSERQQLLKRLERAVPGMDPVAVLGAVLLAKEHFGPEAIREAGVSAWEEYRPRRGRRAAQ